MPNIKKQKDGVKTRNSESSKSLKYLANKAVECYEFFGETEIKAFAIKVYFYC